MSSKKKFNCPRCNGDNVKDFGDIIECLDCKLEFDKSDINIIDDKSNILSIQEKKKVIDVFKNFQKSDD